MVQISHQSSSRKILVKSGNLSKATEVFQTCVDVTPEMAYAWIKVLKARGIIYLVAPYEADAQLAYLAMNGKIHAVITEDSDLLTFGCPRVCYKLDHIGAAIELRSEDFGAIKVKSSLICRR